MSDDGEVDYTLPPWGTLGRNFTLGVVSGGSKVILQVLNTLDVKDRGRFLSQVFDREPGTPLFTVCNHIRSARYHDSGILYAALTASRTRM